MASTEGSGSCPRVDGADIIAERHADMLSDESKLSASGVDRVYFPESSDQVAAAMREAAAEGLAVTVSGARTGITGGAVPIDSNCIISLQRMDGVLDIRCENGAASALLQAGIPLNKVAEDLSARNWGTLCGGESTASYYYPVDPTEKGAFIGGTIATNASGARSFYYGATRKWVRSVKVVLADGRLFDVRRGDVKADGLVLKWPEAFGDKELPLPDLARPGCKCAAAFMVEAGVDLVDLFVGSEGTLGIITEAEVALAPVPENLLSLMCFLPPASDGMALVQSLRDDDRLSPLAIEYFDLTALQLLREERERSGDDKIPEVPASAGSAVFVEQPYVSDDDLDELVCAVDEALTKHGGSIDDTWAGDDDAQRERMRLLRHSVPEAVNNIIARRKRDIPELHKVGTDLAVSEEVFPTLLKAYREDVPASGLEYVIFGHAGENHLHVNLIPRSLEELARARALHADLARRVKKLGGSVTGEHGIGRLKRDLLEIQYGSEGVRGLRAVKDFFDPKGALNPGVLFEKSR